MRFTVRNKKDLKSPSEMQQGTLNYLGNIETHYPYWYSKETRWTLSAYALYVRNLYGDRDAQKAQSLINEAGLDKPIHGSHWLVVASDR